MSNPISRFTMPMCHITTPAPDADCRKFLLNLSRSVKGAMTVVSAKSAQSWLTSSRRYL